MSLEPNNTREGVAERPRKPGGGFWRYLDDRLGIGGLRYPVPSHANTVLHTLGGITAVSFVLLFVTGVYLAQYYHPTAEEAHRSVFFIIEEASLGELARSLHYWLASAFILTLILHMVRTFASAAYKPPREFVWVSGVLLLLAGIGLLFTGTVLKADQEAVEALEHNNEIADIFGSFGFWFSSDFTNGVSQITRLYIAHISILPMLLVAVLAIHMLLIKRHRLAPLPWGTPEEVRERAANEREVPFTSHLRHIGAWGLVVLGITLALAALAPAGLGPAGVEGIEITKPPWYFLWLYPWENWIGLQALYVIPGILVVCLLALPFVDRSPERDPRRRRLLVGLAAIGLIAWIALTIYGAVTVPAEHVG